MFAICKAFIYECKVVAYSYYNSVASFPVPEYRIAALKARWRGFLSGLRRVPSRFCASRAFRLNRGALFG